MPITRADLEKRLADLRAEQAQIQENIVQLQANLNAFAGAIQDVEYWLSILDPAPEETDKQEK
jgi:septal ring factor EnvC (AmiA/AmiB activator)